MTVTTVRKIPSELPHAHLYLEDVEEICKILLDAFSRPSTSQPTILFSIGDDLQMDSIDDLERRGGSAKDFGIEVVGYSYDRIRFQSFMNPEADLFILAYIVFLGLIAFVIFRSSRVSFVRSHDRFKQVSEVRRGYFRDVFMLILGGVIGKVIDFAVRRWLK